MELKDFGKGGRGSPALPYILLAGNRSHRGDDGSCAMAQGTETRLRPELASTPLAAIERHAKKRTRCGDSARCHATSASPRKLRKAHGKTQPRTRALAITVNVFGQTHLFSCLTSARCILYAGCPVNAHLPTSRFYCIYAAPFRFPDTIGVLFIVVQPRPCILRSGVLAI
jgi:hypothetical protein